MMKCTKCSNEQVAMTEDFGVFDYRVEMIGGDTKLIDPRLLGIIRINLCKSCIQSLHVGGKKTDGELKIWRILLTGLIFFIGAAAIAATGYPQGASLFIFVGISVIIFQIDMVRKEKDRIARQAEAYRKAEADDFKNTSLTDFINVNSLKKLGLETLVNYEQVMAMKRETTDANQIAASDAASQPLPPEEKGHCQIYYTMSLLNDAFEEEFHRPLDEVIQSVYKIKTGAAQTV